MAYSDFTLQKAQKAFQLELLKDMELFRRVADVPVSDALAALLQENVPLAESINTEKARSELVVMNVLLEVRKHFQRTISVFSGSEFNVDKAQGLTGFCDFLISRSPEQLFINAPVVALVEAKNDNLMGGVGQCVAEMVAAQIFNQQEGNNIAKIYGAVTTGIEWKFMRLVERTVWLDLQDYHIETPARILGILTAMINQEV